MQVQELQQQDGEGRLGQTAGGADLHSLVLGHHMVDFFLNLTLCQQLIVEENPLGPQHPPVYQVNPELLLLLMTSLRLEADIRPKSEPWL